MNIPSHEYSIAEYLNGWGGDALCEGVVDD
jgi:hypothetical protein